MLVCFIPSLSNQSGNGGPLGGQVTNLLLTVSVSNIQWGMRREHFSLKENETRHGRGTPSYSSTGHGYTTLLRS